MPELNPAQSEAVRYLDSPLLVLAGAGSGKTRVITEKIAHLIADKGMNPRNVAAVTFTNKAAREMKERIGKRLEGTNTRGLMISTFHTLGLTILKRDHKRLELKPGFSIYDGRDAEALLLELMKRDAGTDKDFVSRVRHTISMWKNGLVSPEQAMNEAEDQFSLLAAQAFVRYEAQLRAYNAVDLDDMIGLPVRLFEQDRDALEHWQNRIRYLLVDEYQDTNATQYQLVKLLVGPREALTVVGDDDQSIYAWRGARPENMAHLKDDFPGLKVIKLEQNYRSSGRILKAANSLIANNPHVFDKRLWSALGAGDPIRIVRCRDEGQEAERIVSDIVHHRFSKRTRAADYAILFRGNHQARLFEKALREQGVPYVLAGGQSFFDYAEIKDLLAYIKLICNPADSGAFLRVANVPRREIGPTTLEKLTRYAGMRETSLVDASLEMGLSSHLGERAVKRLRQFSEWVMTMHRETGDPEPKRVFSRLLADTGYEDYIRDQYEEPQAERRLQNLNELGEWIRKMAEKNPEGDLSDIIGQLALIDALDRAENEEAGDRVTLMTLHAAKGLEFPYVYLVGVEENILPHRTSIEEDSVEEERRLAYVGITRAQKALIISLCRKRRRFGEVEECEPSRFLEELPQDDLQWEGIGVERDPEVSKQMGKAHLANLRELLG
ncbi:MAG: DNA helicase Rep [Gammaproteobacteria bacterium]